MKRMLATVLLCATLLCGCSAWREPEKTDCFAMDTFVSMQAYGGHAEHALSVCVEELRRLETLLSISSESGDVARIAGTAGVKTTVSEDTASVLQTALAVSRMTDGAFDPSIYPLVALWGFYGGEKRVPAQTEIDEAITHVDWRRIALDGDAVTIGEGMRLDLGGIAKGYAGDRLKAILRASGVQSAWISLGGNVAVLGEKPDGSAWRIGILDPRDQSGVIGSVSVRDASVVTAGDYQRFFTQDGRSYHHILVPATGYPADSGLLSVTVIDPDGARADALSTALFVLGLERSLALWRDDKTFAAVFVKCDGVIVCTENAMFSASNKERIIIAE